MIGQFHDDAQRTRLRTLLTQVTLNPPLLLLMYILAYVCVFKHVFSQYPPAEVLTERGVVSDETTRILSYMCKSALKDELIPKDEFWSSEKCKTVMCKEGLYFKSSSDASDRERVEVPEVLSACCASDSASLALSALGAAAWLLTRSLVDEEVFSMGKFSAYCPPDLEQSEVSQVEDMEQDKVEQDNVEQSAEDFAASPVFKSLPKQCSELSDLYWVATGQRFIAGSGGNIFSQEASTSKSPKSDLGSRMLLDGAALTNLEVLLSTDGDEQGSLFKYLNRTNTSFGKRLLKEWVCAPLLNTPEIEGPYI